uniref:CONSTANS-like 4 protein n=1 Tax=Gossypium herbaceum subsp. africanum TaxID=76056 RepID=A0A0D3R3B0_GOSHE|nr:CONSTANS-like 4 protein [Gossypium herbaceum subsp. africanum]
MASKLCDSCKLGTSDLFCRPHSAFLCCNCDSTTHAANHLASPHPRFCLCQVCEQAPARVTCKADAAALCVACDQHIHSANPLARQHVRLPIIPFYDSDNSVPAVKSNCAVNNFLGEPYFSAVDGDTYVNQEETEAASWLLPNPNHKAVESPVLYTGQFLFSEIDLYLDLDHVPLNLKIGTPEQTCSGTDAMVPTQSKSVDDPSVNHRCVNSDFTRSKSFASYGYNPHCHSFTESSSLEVGGVPDGSAMMREISKQQGRRTESMRELASAEREARVLRYKEKRKKRKFEKTIRYASRKSYAEMRPRIKGRFAKRTDFEPDRTNIYGF